jgi:hypothetical protein
VLINITPIGAGDGHTLGLAREFLVCDRWFASLPTDTFPRTNSTVDSSKGDR